MPRPRGSEPRSPGLAAGSSAPPRLRCGCPPIWPPCCAEHSPSPSPPPFVAAPSLAGPEHLPLPPATGRAGRVPCRPLADSPPRVRVQSLLATVLDHLARAVAHRQHALAQAPPEAAPAEPPPPATAEGESAGEAMEEAASALPPAESAAAETAADAAEAAEVGPGEGQPSDMEGEGRWHVQYRDAGSAGTPWHLSTWFHRPPIRNQPRGSTGLAHTPAAALCVCTAPGELTSLCGFVRCSGGRGACRSSRGGRRQRCGGGAGRARGGRGLGGRGAGAAARHRAPARPPGERGAASDAHKHAGEHRLPAAKHGVPAAGREGQAVRRGAVAGCVTW